MNLSLRQKWSIGLIGVMVLAIPIYYLTRTTKVTAVDPETVSLNPLGFGVEQLTFRDNDLVHFSFRTNGSVDITITQYYAVNDPTKTGNDAVLYEKTLTAADGVVKLDLAVRPANVAFERLLFYNIIVNYNQPHSVLNISYNIQTTNKGFYVSEIVLGTMLALIWIQKIISEKVLK